MTNFLHNLWGYQLTYPDDWVHRFLGLIEGFASISDAFEPDFEGARSGHLLVRADWNGNAVSIGPLWNQHIALTAGMIGAKKVGGSPWQMGGADGVEAEIVLPKKADTRLWTGILVKDLLVLQLMVAHPKSDRQWFEPVVENIIKSLRFVEHIEGTVVNEFGLPLPPGYVPYNPQEIMPDIEKVSLWSAYDGNSTAGALQAFYLREAPAYGWIVEEYIPFPSTEKEYNYSRIRFARGDQEVVLGIMPFDTLKLTSNSLAKIVIKRK